MQRVAGRREQGTPESEVKLTGPRPQTKNVPPHPTPSTLWFSEKTHPKPGPCLLHAQSQHGTRAEPWPCPYQLQSPCKLHCRASSSLSDVLSQDPLCSPTLCIVGGQRGHGLGENPKGP